MLDTCTKCGHAFEQRPWQIVKQDRRCHDCYLEYHRAYRAKRRIAGDPVKTGNMPRDWHREYEREYRERPGVRETLAANQRRYVRNPKRRPIFECRWKTQRAIAAGRLGKQPCEVCGNPIVDAHHDDYSNPLGVRWLCRQHHAEHHAKAKEIEK